VATGALLAVPAVNPAKAPDPFEFVFRAVTTGLTEDGVPPALAAELAERDDFVPKCGLCSPTRKALAQYGQLKAPPAAEDSKGLPEELIKRLKSDKKETRQAALRQLVQRYIERHYARTELTAEQKTALQKEMEQMRKDAMGGLAPGQKFCPSCDGACRLTPKL